MPELNEREAIAGESVSTGALPRNGGDCGKDGAYPCCGGEL